MVIRGKENEYFLTIGQYRVSKLYDTVDELKHDIDNKDWDLIINIMFCVVGFSNEVDELEKTISKAID